MKNDNKERDERFKRVASRRTESVLRSLRSLAKCANTRSYAYTDTQVRKILKAIDFELAACKKAFESMSGRKKFKL
ncbi:MAG: hypothetical protein SCARUB_04662 [Candidatus Scalindua rubra]|uniref:Uncharacterized protein n=1 Tax=Candidatus Scalindua rubra TaxID=1872076 RepID=A0A1E3X3N0_9BACT|nr:MAG: hypothetical protein SCARUB_04662 [Candidatus Scalindua rubra]